MSSTRQVLVVVAFAAFTTGAAIAVLRAEPPTPAGDHAHDHGHDDHDGQDHDDRDLGVGGLPGSDLPDHVDITPAIAEAAGATIAIAGFATIAETAQVMGSIVLDPAGYARVSARFPGIARQIRKLTGDAVAAGEVLAMIDSNESLQSYEVKSPIDGVIVARHISSGEITGAGPLFEIADLGRVWAELHVFPRDLPRVAPGQRVRVSAGDDAASAAGDGVIAALSPVAEAASQSVVARVPLDNADGRWRPGLAVRGTIVTGTHAAEVTVAATAVQTLDGQAVVFVAGPDRFDVRPVRIGAGDGAIVEILDGVRAGETYVANNSFLFKAELGKATVRHRH
ncbi:MAG: efflux RND transporter periplasmic adaptor subunit [Rhodospirillaceae bacterium]|nr:efflux RND transporter periplasmic adaptor subunit [Rhodospirillaceae bacterium]